MLQLHENEVMRAYKTVNDTYIEPISFTVPRRAETFQSDIYPPATGLKPAVSAKEWLDGKAGIPPKIDLESIYEGTEPIEVAADYKPVAAPAPALAPAPSKPAAKPEPSPAIRSPPPTMSDQKTSMSAMASKYKDDEGEEEEEEADETSSFEEVARPAHRAAAPAKPEPRPASPVKVTSPTVTSRRAPSPVKVSQAKSPEGGSSDANAAQIEQLISLVQSQTKLLLAQDSKINRLMDEVDKLQKASAASASHGEKIREIELQLEAMDS